MPGRLVSAEPEAWRYLAEFVQIAREDLQLRISDAVDRANGQISTSVWSILENARQKTGRMEASSLRGASEALGLEPDALEGLVTSPDRLLPPGEAWPMLKAGTEAARSSTSRVAEFGGILARIEEIEKRLHILELQEARRSAPGSGPSAPVELPDDLAYAADADTPEGDAPISYQNRPSPPAKDGEHLEG